LEKIDEKCEEEKTLTREMNVKSTKRKQGPEGKGKDRKGKKKTEDKKKGKKINEDSTQRMSEKRNNCKQDCEELGKEKELDVELYAQRMALLVRQSKIVGCGLATAKSMARLNRGMSIEESGEKIGSAGNGAASRGSPLGMMYFWGSQRESMVRAASRQSMITHKDPRCAAGTVAIAGSVALALHLHPFFFLSPEGEDGRKENVFPCHEFIEKISEWVHVVDVDVATRLLLLKKWLPSSIQKKNKMNRKKITEMAREIARAEVSGMDFDDGTKDGVPGFITSSVLWAIYSFLSFPFDWSLCIKHVILGAGDSDSTAAMAGAISGAFVGATGLPHLVNYVNDMKCWEIEELTKLAEECWEICKR